MCFYLRRFALFQENSANTKEKIIAEIGCSMDEALAKLKEADEAYMLRSRKMEEIK